MKAKRCIALVLSLLLLTACAAPEPALIEELYGNEASSGKAEISRSIDELWRFDDLVQVKILARSELLQASYLHQMPDATLRQWVLYTDYTLLVEDTIRGPLSPGEVLHAKCMGGESPDGWSYTPLTYNQVYVHPNDRAPALQPGASYILMLQNDATVWEEGNVPAKTMDPREGLYIAVQDGVIEGQRSYFPDFKMPEEKMDAEAYKAMLREHIAVQEAAYREYALTEVPLPEIRLLSCSPYRHEVRGERVDAFVLKLGYTQQADEKLLFMGTLVDGNGETQTFKGSFYLLYDAGTITIGGIVPPSGGVSDVYYGCMEGQRIVYCRDERLLYHRNFALLELLPEMEYSFNLDFYDRRFINSVGPRYLGSQTLTFTTGSLPDGTGE